MDDDYNDFKYTKDDNKINQKNLVYYFNQPQKKEEKEKKKEVPFNTISAYNQNRNNYEKGVITSTPPKDKLRYVKVIIPVILVLVLSSLLIVHLLSDVKESKERTFMIYMVGSDLESKSKQGTYSISDIVGNNIDLENNNVVLMVGGSKKWHNFVNAEEIGIYSLTKEGFVKNKSLPVESMGSSDTLETFLDYCYDNYSSEKYDMIFWNHGLGAIGIEEDELSDDFLTISELNKALKNSPFNDKKLELTIFYNCLASNLHMANIMKNYSDYMVASEEIFYLSRLLNRLKFLEDVEKDDSAYDIGYLFVEQSDKVTEEYNNTHTKKIDSTLSIIDLNNINELNKKLNNFIESIDVKDNYYEISKYRRKAHTYGVNQTYDYDTVDLYELVSALGEITNNNDSAKKVLKEIDNTIKHLSSLNDYSKGISVYFPYFGNDTSIETHLSLFSKVFNDSYYKFINNFNQIRSGTKKARKSARNNQVNYLTNNVVKEENGSLSITLTDTEKKNFQDASIYIFSKKDDSYELLLQSDKLNLINNKIVFNDNKLLKVNNNIISYISDKQMVYGRLSDNKDTLDVKFSIDNNKISEAVLDSNDYISSSLVEYSDYKEKSFAKLSYNLFENGLFNEDFKETVKKDYIKVDKNKLNISISNNMESDYFVLIEMKDIYNDSYYSKLELIS